MARCQRPNFGKKIVCFGSIYFRSYITKLVIILFSSVTVITSFKYFKRKYEIKKTQVMNKKRQENICVLENLKLILNFTLLKHFHSLALQKFSVIKKDDALQTLNLLHVRNYWFLSLVFVLSYQTSRFSDLKPRYCRKTLMQSIYFHRTF